MPKFSKTEALEILNTRKSELQQIVDVEKDGTSYLRLQIDDRVIAEFSGKNGKYIHFSTTWPIDAQHFGPNAKKLQRLSAASDLEALNAPNIDQERSSVRWADGTSDEFPRGVNISESKLLKDFMAYSEALQHTTPKEDALIGDAITSLTAICAQMPDVVENPNTPNARKGISELLNDVAAEFETIAKKYAASTQIEDAANRSHYATNLKKLSASLSK